MTSRKPHGAARRRTGSTANATADVRNAATHAAFAQSYGGHVRKSFRFWRVFSTEIQRQIGIDIDIESDRDMA